MALYTAEMIRFDARRHGLAALFLFAYGVLMLLLLLHIQEDNLLRPSWHVKHDVNGVVVRDANGHPIRELDLPK